MSRSSARSARQGAKPRSTRPRSPARARRTNALGNPRAPGRPGRLWPGCIGISGSASITGRKPMERWKRLLSDLESEFLLREDELRLLHEIDLRLLASERPLNATFDFIVDRTEKLLGSDHTAILLRRGRFLEPAYSTTKSEVGQQIEISSCLIGECLNGDTPINVPDIAAP